ncbi:MAG: hypothetical protein DCF13_07190 [Flavobacteriaceae bacterium]|nr:MAG: hypothetical protein DCF13_07190 [Flavobacteriaceae bacterium]
MFRFSVLSWVVLLLLVVSPVAAQYDIDSLKGVVKNPKLHDTTRLYNIALLIDNLYENQEVVPYNALMGSIAQKNLQKKNLTADLHKKYTMYLAAYYNNISIQLEDNGNPKALNYLNKSIGLYRSVKADDEVYSSIVSKGILLSRRKRYKEAISCYFDALRYFEKNREENADGISYVYTNLGVLYGDQEQWRESIKYLKKAAFVIDQKKEKKTVEDELQKFAMYYNIGSAYVTLNDYKNGEEYLKKALALSKKHNQNSYTSFALGKLAMVDLHYKREDEAEQKFLESSKIAESSLSKGFSLVNLGDLYYQKKDYDKSKRFLEEGLALAKEVNKDDLKGQAYELLYKINKLKGNYKESVQMLELYNSIKDSNKVVETKNELKQQQLKYDYEKKELNYKLATEKKNAAKNNLLIGLSALVVLLLIGAYFLYRNYKQKQTISAFEKKELKQKLLLTQMNPHFIFNSIDNIQSLIYNKQEKEAVNYLTKFSKLTRQILENSNENYITLEEELTMIDNYLSIQQLLYNNKFDYTVKVADGIDAEAILVPPMLTQPFIENAIKHGLKNTTEKGKIAIEFVMKDKQLGFQITDNGSGFGSAEKDSSKKSLAMKITKERLSSLAKNNHFEVHVENVLDVNKSVVGARVYFDIPYLYEN